MNSCMWAAFYLGDEGDNAKIIVINYHLSKTLAKFSEMEQLFGQLLRTEFHVFSDSVLCRATKFSEFWDSSTFMDKYDITGRPVQFHWHTFSSHTALQFKKEIQTFLVSTEPCDFKCRNMFMLVFHNI